MVNEQINIALEPYVTDNNPVSQLTWSVKTPETDLITVTIDSSTAATITARSDTGQAQVIITVIDREGLQVSAAIQVVVQSPLKPLLPADFDGNGRIDLGDFFLFVEFIGSTPLYTNWNPTFDLNYDGQVSLEDFFIFSDAFNSFNRLD